MNLPVKGESEQQRLQSPTTTMSIGGSIIGSQQNTMRSQRANTGGGGNRPPHTASKATRELDSLMSSLSQFKVC